MSGAIALARRRASMLIQAHAPQPNPGNIRVSLFRHSTGVRDERVALADRAVAREFHQIDTAGGGE